MAHLPPKGRKPLSAEALFRLVHTGFDHMPDYRPVEADIALPDVFLSAFAMFSLQAPSLLACDKERAAGNVHTIYGIPRVPCDTDMRELLAPLSPKALRPLCQRLVRQRQRGKALEPMVCLDGHSCWAREGTAYFSSKTMPCAACVPSVHRNGALTSAQHMVGAAILPPDQRAVIPRMPEPIMPRDGTDNNDGARHAATRCVGTRRQDHPPLTCLVTAERLRANAPHSETLQEHDRHDLLGGKEGDHASLCQQVEAAEQAGRVTSAARHDRAAQVVHRFRLVHQVPLNASNSAVQVNGIASWEIGQKKVQHCSRVTDVRVSQRNVSQLLRGGRARWKIATEAFTTLKNQGDHFAHTYGQGAPPLSVVCAVRRRLAFLVDQTPQRGCALFQAVWAKLGSTRMLWERLRALLYDEALASRRQLCAALVSGVKTSSPMGAMDASASPSLSSATACQRTKQPGDLPSWGRALPPSRDASAFNQTAWHVESSKLFKRQQWMVETRTELSASIVT